jgi:hypothetical protein
MQNGGQYLQTLPLLQDNLARTRKVLGDDDQRVAHALGSLGTSWKTGRIRQAETAYKEAGIWTKVEGPDGAGAASEINLGGAPHRRPQCRCGSSMRSALRRLYCTIRKPQARTHLRIGWPPCARAGKPRSIRWSSPCQCRRHDKPNATFAAAQIAFVEALLRLDRASEAQTRGQSALELMLETRPPDIFNTGRAQFLLGCAEAAQGRHAEAETMLRQAIATLALDEEAVHGPRLIEAKIQLAETLMASANATKFPPSPVTCMIRSPETSIRTKRNCARLQKFPPAEAAKRTEAIKLSWLPPSPLFIAQARKHATSLKAILENLVAVLESSDITPRRCSRKTTLVGEDGSALALQPGGAGSPHRGIAAGQQRVRRCRAAVILQRTQRIDGLR